MCKFLRLIVDRNNLKFENTHYLSKVIFLYIRNSKYLNDDYAPKFDLCNFIDCIEQEKMLFYIILDAKNNEFAGFVYLDNPVGNDRVTHSCELTTCFERKYWGNFTKLAAKLFFEFCFENLGLQKIKAQVYPFNTRVRTLLKKSGFHYDGTLRAETLKNGKLQDIDVYSLLKSDICNLK